MPVWQSSTTKAFIALLYRNVLSVKKTYREGLINALMVSLTTSYSFGFLLPLIGIPPSLTASMFIGALFFTCVQMIHTRAMAFVFDIQSVRTLDFYMITPIPHTFFIATQTISLMLEFFIISFPSLLLGKLFLGSWLTFEHAQWPYALVVYFLTLLLFSLFTLALGLGASFRWFTISAHPRCLVPLAHLGCANVPWSSLAPFFPTLKYLFLISPLTYIVEGLRQTLLGNQTIPLSICVLVSSIFCCVCFVSILYILKKRLDYV